MISIGYDPAPPGKYPLKRAIVDSDLDGITSGAILKTVYPDIEIILGDPYRMQLGKFAEQIDKETATADLPYQAGVGLYFDHHAGNRPATDEVPGRWQEAKNSAARVVYDYFKDVADLAKFEPMLVWVDKFDRGHVTKTEIESKVPLLELGMALQHSNDLEVKRVVLKQFIEKQEADLTKDPVISKFLRDAEMQLHELIEHLDRYTEVNGKFVFVDLRKFGRDIMIHNYKYAALFPQCSAIILIKNGDEGTTKITFYGNVFADQKEDLDLLAIAKKINPTQSGGHKDACGATIPAGMSVDDAKQIILNFSK